MSSNIFPIPINTPFWDKSTNGISISWQMYLKNIGDDLVLANKVQGTSEAKATNIDFKFVQNGNIIFCTYYKLDADTDPVILTLPVKSRLAFSVNGTIYPPDTNSVTIQAGTVLAQFWFVS